jgi:hypothetical protein
VNQILVNPLERVGGTALKEITIGEKILKTIQTIPKLQKRSDIALFEKHIKNLPSFEGIALDLWSLPRTCLGVDIRSKQATLDNRVQPVSALGRLLEDRVLFIDPNTESYRYRFPESDGTRQSMIMDQRGFPQAVRETFNFKNHNAAWKDLREKKQILAFASWHVDYSIEHGANLIIPPAPLVDGSSPTILNIAAQINQTARTLVFKLTDAFCAFYLAIDPIAFRDEMWCKRIMETIKANTTTNSLLVLKFFRMNKVLSDCSSRMRLSRFLSSLDAHKQSLDDQIGVMVLDSKAEGLALMGNGVDISCDPLGGVNDEVQFRRAGKEQDTGDEDADQKNKYSLYGKYFHPDTRDFTKMTDLIEMLPPEGTLPHDCHFCQSLHGRLVDGGQFPRSDEWNSLRRMHNFTCRREEDKLLMDAIKEGNERAVELYLGQQVRGNKNLVDLLPTTPTL